MIQTLVVGMEELSDMYRACLLSYLKQDQEITLYTYNDLPNVPDGVIVKPGQDILPESRIFKAFGTYSSFANMFRFKMLFENGGWWVDLDTFCLKPFPKVASPFSGLERGRNGALLRNNAIIYAEPGDPVIRECHKFCMARKENLPMRGYTGPKLITYMMRDEPLEEKYEFLFGGLHWFDSEDFFTKPLSDIPTAKDAYCLHWYGHFVDQHLSKGINQDCAFAECLRSVGIDLE